MKLDVIYNEDCLEGMKKLPDKTIDLIITDMPYGVSIKKPNHTYMVGDHINIFPVVLPLFYRVLKDDGAIFIFSSTSKLHEFLIQFQVYFKLHNILIWDKIRSLYPHSKAHFRMQYEMIMYGSKGLHHLKNKKGSDIIQERIPAGKKRVHPTQKPEELIIEILKSTQESKQLILDPFMGSGTTAVACKRLGRHYIGFEINPDYCKIANQRLEAEETLWDRKEVAHG